MTTELLANNYTTTLSGNGGSITAGATSFNIVGTLPAALQAAGQFRVIIDQEIMIVPGGQSGPALTGVTRGAETTLNGGPAAAHNDGAIVAHTITAGGPVGTIAGAISNTSQSSPMLFVDSYLSGWSPTTDVTTGFQSAMDAASTIGSSLGVRVPLYCTPGRQYTLTTVVPKSYVDLRCHGSRFKMNPAQSLDHGLFWVNPAVGFGAAITQFAMRGASMIGTLGETDFQGLLLIAQSSWITIEDCWINNVGAVGIYVVDCQYAWVERNRLLNVGSTAGGQNALNLVSGNHGDTSPLQHVWADKNTIVANSGVSALNLPSSGSNRTDPIVDAHITNNTCYATNANPLWVEQGGATVPPNISTIDISGNTVVTQGTTASIYGIVLSNDSSVLTSDPLCISDVTISNNRVRATTPNASGIRCSASDASITGNRIAATIHDIWLLGPGSATIGHITATGNTGHHGSGDEVHIGVQVDTTTVSSSNTP